MCHSKAGGMQDEGRPLVSESIEPVGLRKHWQVVIVGVDKPVAARSPWRLSQCILDTAAIL